MATFVQNDRSPCHGNDLDLLRQQIIDLLNKAYTETARGDVVANSALLIDSLLNFTTAHFYLIEHTMPKTHTLKVHRKHRELHKALMDGVVELQIACRIGKPVPVEVLSLLINWFQHSPATASRS